MSLLVTTIMTSFVFAPIIVFMLGNVVIAFLDDVGIKGGAVNTLVIALMSVIDIVVSWIVTYFAFVYFYAVTTSIILLTLFLVEVSVAVWIYGDFTSERHSGYGETDYGFYAKIFSVLFLIMSMIVFPVGALFTVSYREAQYFNTVFKQANGVPMHSMVSYTDLRVVDVDLAKSIMTKANPFGANTKVTDIHIGTVNNKTYWIGAVVYQTPSLKPSLNYYQGFICVDITDPSKTPLIINKEFYVGSELAYGKNLYRVVKAYNFNYEVGQNHYYYFDTGKNIYYYVVPYGKYEGVLHHSQYSGMMVNVATVFGGVLVLDDAGNVVKDYQFSPDKGLGDVPSWIVQPLHEELLENALNSWGTKRKDNGEIGYWTNELPFTKTTHAMGIDEDVRVVFNTDTKQNFQYVLLDNEVSIGEDGNKLLMGAIVVNASGIYYYDLADYYMIDTNTAVEHAESAISNYMRTTSHGIEPIMPVLYPVYENSTDWTQYAYVMPLMYKDIRPVGVAIVDPVDKTGIKTVVVIPDENDASYGDMDAILTEALNKYHAIHGEQENTTTLTQESFLNGTLKIGSKYSYVENGSTVIIINGLFTNNTNNQQYNVSVVFRQANLSLPEWLVVTTATENQTVAVQGQLTGETFMIAGTEYYIVIATKIYY